MKNFIKFGIQKKNKTLKTYEEKKGDLYDTYMLGRYFEDIFNLQRLYNNKVKFKKNLFHDIKDLRFNLIHHILWSNYKKKFYEFGFTAYEKIFYFKFFNSVLNKKIDISKIEFRGNDISERLIFFCQNFYKDYKISLDRKKFNQKNYSQSVFFSKGVTLLYEKQNIKNLKNFINYSECGSFDISLYPKKKIRLLETGLNLYYPSIISFINLINNSNKKIYFRNKKKENNKIYLEILFGDENVDKIINKRFKYLSKKKFPFKRYLHLNKKFKELKIKDLE